ncbi:MAG: DedA family protein [Balneolaceae bacterium]|nr:DedA family protein [Balneolaceae bacterium]
MLEQLTTELVEWIYALPPISIYGVFLAVAYLENVVPPIPGDVLVAFGGYLAAESVIGLTPVYLLTTVASVAGFMTMYALGSRWGTQLEEKKRHWLVRFVPLQYITRTQAWMKRWGQGVVVANRFLAGTRSVIALTAGISHTPPARTVLSSAVSSLLWNALLLAFGWVVHENWRVIGDYLSAWGQAVLVLLALGLLARLAWVRLRSGSGGDDGEGDEAP